MIKRLVLSFVLLMGLFVSSAIPSDYTQQQTWVNGETITHTKLNVDIAGIIAVLNDLGNANIAASAGIKLSKLDLDDSTAAFRDMTVTVADTDNKVAITATQNDTTNNGNVVNLVNAGTGTSLSIDHNGVTGKSLLIDSESATTLVDVDHGTTVLATANHGLYVHSNVATVAADAALVKVLQDSATATEPALEIDNDGTGAAIEINNFAATANGGIYFINDSVEHGLYISQDKELNSGAHSLYIHTNALQRNADSALLKITQDNASSTEPALEIQNDGTGGAFTVIQNGAGNPILVDNNSSSASLSVDQDVSHTSAVVATLLDITNTNAGAGADAIGIRVITAATGGDGYTLDVQGDSIVATAVGGSQNKKLRVLIGGTDYYIPLYTS